MKYLLHYMGDNEVEIENISFGSWSLRFTVKSILSEKYQGFLHINIFGI